MKPTHALSALASLLSAASTASATDLGVPGPWDPKDPFIKIQNTGKTEICYKVEFTTGNFPTPTTCDSSPGIKVPPGQTVTVHTGPGFNGALTAIIGNVKGARHEINYAADPQGSCWYDIDYQLGMSDSTLGPADHHPRQGGAPGSKPLSSLSGEQDTLAKAEAAWPQHTPNRDALLKLPKYIQVSEKDKDKLTRVYMDGEAPEVVKEFFQLTADFVGYVGAGSVEGELRGGVRW